MINISNTPTAQRHRIFEGNLHPIQEESEICIEREVSDGYDQGFDIQMEDGDFLISFPVHVVHGSTGPEYETLNPPTLAKDPKRICAILYLHFSMENEGDHDTARYKRQKKGDHRKPTHPSDFHLKPRKV